MTDHGTRAHALLSASGASRWMTCTPSARLEDNEPESTSVFAEEGTLAHEFGDINLRHAIGQMGTKHHLKEKAKLELHELYTPEMDEYVDMYTNYCLSQFHEKGGIMLVEEKVDLTAFIEDGFGTNDDIIIADGEMEVIDLKYGKGIKVDADDNSQLKLYGLGALMKYDMAYDIRTVRLTIVQPRLDHISTWVIEADKLRNWGETVVKPKAKMAYAGEGELVSGDHCKWCKAKPRCRRLRDDALEMAKHDFKAPALLTDEEILEVYRMSKLVSDWIGSVGAYIVAEAKDGKKWEGYKLVEGRSRRTWTDQDAVATALFAEGKTSEEVYDTKLKGIGAIEKLVGKKNFRPILGKLVAIPSGKPTLVEDDDKRPALGMESAQNDFTPADPLA